VAHVVDRFVVCDAFCESDRHDQLLTGGRSKRIEGRRHSMHFLAAALDARGRMAGAVGRQGRRRQATA